MSKNTHLQTLALALLTTGIATVSVDSLADEKTNAPAQEKCYGIVKAAKNDCASAARGHSCQGLSAKDGDTEEYIFVIKGTCEKIVGGKLKN